VAEKARLGRDEFSSLCGECLLRSRGAGEGGYTRHAVPNRTEVTLSRVFVGSHERGDRPYETRPSIGGHRYLGLGPAAECMNCGSHGASVVVAAARFRA
jgi:hypothetical protein